MSEDVKVRGDAPSLRESLVTVTEADLRAMYHALGCPEGRWITPYRNYYAIDADSSDARRFMQLGRWVKYRDIPGGLSYFSVTPEGIEDVFGWLDDRADRKGLRPYVVSSQWVGDHVERTVLAKSPSGARYAYFLEISDVWPDGFGDWLNRMQPRVRLLPGNRKDGSSQQTSTGSPQ